MIDGEYTDERYRCKVKWCRYVGPAIKDKVSNRTPKGVELVYEPICARCGDNRVEETTDE